MFSFFLTSLIFFLPLQTLVDYKNLYIQTNLCYVTFQGTIEIGPHKTGLVYNYHGVFPYIYNYYYITLRMHKKTNKILDHKTDKAENNQRIKRNKENMYVCVCLNTGWCLVSTFKRLEIVKTGGR